MCTVAGALIGYARVSTAGQILDRQTRALTEAGCIRVFAGKVPGKTADRPELAAYLDYLCEGEMWARSQNSLPKPSRRFSTSTSGLPFV